MQNADFIQSFLGGNVDVHDVVVVVVVVVISQRMLVYCSKIRNISARFHEVVDLRGLELLLLLLLFFNWSSQHIPQHMSRNRAAGVHHPGYSI